MLSSGRNTNSMFETNTNANIGTGTNTMFETTSNSILGTYNRYKIHGTDTNGILGTDTNTILGTAYIQFLVQHKSSLTSCSFADAAHTTPWTAVTAARA